MTRPVARMWQDVLDMLSEFAELQAEGVVLDTVLLLDLLHVIEHMPQQPTATWKRLLQDMRLPYQLGMLATSKLPEPLAAGLMLQGAVTRAIRAILFTAPWMPWSEARFNVEPTVNKPKSKDLQLEALAVLMYRQVADSGLLMYWEHLVLAVAEQLEQCNAAAAAGGGLQDTAAAAAEMHAISTEDLPIQKLGLLSLGQLQETATQLLLLQLQRPSLMRAAAHEEFNRRDASNRAAIRRLIIAGMAHISMVLQHQPDQQQVPSEQLLGLAQVIAINAFKELFCAEGGSSAQSCDVGPHTVAWADITLLLVTYACTLKQHGHLPALSTQGGPSSSGGSGRGSSSRSSSSCSRSRSRSRSSSSSSSNQQRRRNKKGQDCELSLDAWQVAQGQVQHVPATHKQLLGLFGVSTQAAVWIAATMLECPGDLPSPAGLLWSNPHCLAAELGGYDRDGDPPPAQFQAAVDEVRPQLQQWAATPLELLLQPVLLYSTAYAAAGKEGLLAQSWLKCSSEGDTAAASAGPAGETESTEQAAGVPNGNAELSSLPPAVREEMLLLTLILVQSLQQGQQQRSASSSSSAVPAAGAALFEPSFAATAESILIRQLVLQVEGVHVALSACAAPAAARQATELSPMRLGTHRK